MQRTHDWYNKNEARSWPIDEFATSVDDIGRYLPTDILADLHLWFPDTLGHRAFISAVTVSPSLVTVIILSEAPGNAAIATVSLKQPVKPYKPYNVESTQPGVGGWIVFGSRVNDVKEVESYRFANPDQSLLLVRTARRYSQFPVRSVGKINVQPTLKGIVNLKGGRDIETLKAQREIGGVTRDVAVIRLRDKTTGGTSSRNVDEIYAGPCGKRPESINCGSPVPIEFINEVPPDCCGRIYIEIRGCAELFEIANMNGVILDCGFGLGDACVTDAHLPDERGRLPNEYDDLCELTETPPTAMAMAEPVSESFTTIVTMMQPDVEATPEGLPFFETFSNGEAKAFTVDAGDFTFLPRETINGVGYGGSVLFMDFQDDDKCFVRFGEEHGLSVGDAIVTAHHIEDRLILLDHEVTEIDNDVAVYTQVRPVTAFTDKPSQGVWIKQTRLDTGPDGGGIGLSESVEPVQLTADMQIPIVTGLNNPFPGPQKPAPKPDEYGSRFTCAHQHLLTTGDKVAVIGNSDPHYNVGQLVLSVDGNNFTTGLKPTDASGRSVWLPVLSRGGGVVVRMRSNGQTGILVKCEDCHGLTAGDRIIIVSSHIEDYTQLHVVERIISGTEFLIKGRHVNDDSGIWYLVRPYNKTETVYQSDTTARSISLWTEGAPRQPSWTCFHKQLAVTLRFQPMGATHRLNGGLLFNYRREGDKRSFCLLELDHDVGKLLRLWQVRGGSWVIWDQAYIPDLRADMPYRMTLDIMPYSDKRSDVIVTARLDGFEQDNQYQLEPRRIPQFSPSTGLLGLHANRSCVQFSNFQVRHID